MRKILLLTIPFFFALEAYASGPLFIGVRDALGVPEKNGYSSVSGTLGIDFMKVISPSTRFRTGLGLYWVDADEFKYLGLDVPLMMRFTPKQHFFIETGVNLVLNGFSEHKDFDFYVYTNDYDISFSAVAGYSVPFRNSALEIFAGFDIGRPNLYSSSRDADLEFKFGLAWWFASSGTTPVLKNEQPVEKFDDKKFDEPKLDDENLDDNEDDCCFCDEECDELNNAENNVE
ncbi:MAG: hypothetical protein HUK20_01440 [Fibrobacter sp.]|nr:hypothetical protein [Fibrobacter sp.]